MTFRDFPIPESRMQPNGNLMRTSIKPAGLDGLAESFRHHDSLILYIVPLLFKMLITLFFKINVPSYKSRVQGSALSVGALRHLVRLLPTWLLCSLLKKLRLSAPKVSVFRIISKYGRT